MAWPTSQFRGFQGEMASADRAEDGAQKARMPFEHVRLVRDALGEAVFSLADDTIGGEKG
jgi:hypothetical protein